MSRSPWTDCGSPPAAPCQIPPASVSEHERMAVVQFANECQAVLGLAEERYCIDVEAVLCVLLTRVQDLRMQDGFVIVRAILTELVVGFRRREQLGLGISDLMLRSIADIGRRSDVDPTVGSTGVVTGCSALPDKANLAPAPSVERVGLVRIRDRRIRQAIAAIEREHANPYLAEKTVAGRVGLSRSRFGRLFKKEAGATFQHELTRARLEAARNLLSDTCLSIKEVVHRVGFVHASSFDRAFRRVFGCTPTEWRISHHDPSR